jgi:hypothetical protein
VGVLELGVRSGRLAAGKSGLARLRLTWAAMAPRSFLRLEADETSEFKDGGGAWEDWVAGVMGRPSILFRGGGRLRLALTASPRGWLSKLRLPVVPATWTRADTGRGRPSGVGVG